MSRLYKVFFWGMCISAIGTLPLGTLNIMAMELSVEEGYGQAYVFALGTALVEILYVRISLVGMDWVQRRQKLFVWLDWLSVLIVVALAIASFSAAGMHQASHNVIVPPGINRFVYGLFISAINPVQIPFWFGWSTVLFSKNILQANHRQYNVYISGIGLGTMAGQTVFILGGRLFAETLQKNAAAVNYIVGAVFTLTAIIQLVKIVKGKGLAGTLQKK